MKRLLRHLLVLGALAGFAVVMGYRIRENIRPLPPEADIAPSEPPPAAQVAAAPAPTRYRPPPFERFAVILKRPLLLRSRRPVEVEAPAPPAPVRRTLEATLQGVLYSATGKVALLSRAASSDVARVAEGEEYQGWRLTEITPDSATFTRDDETVTLRLTYKGDE